MSNCPECGAELWAVHKDHWHGFFEETHIVCSNEECEFVTHEVAIREPENE